MRATRLTRPQFEWLAIGGVALLVFGVLGALNSGAIGPWNYLAGVLIIISVYTLFALGLSLQFGQAGLLNFGHVAFMGVGAYTVAIVSMRWGDALAPRMEGMSPLGMLTALLGALLAAAVALVPALLASERLLSGRPARVRAIAASVFAALVGVLAFIGMFPFDRATAPNGVVLLGIVGGVLLAALASLLLGIPAIRLREDYLAIVTLGFAEMFRAVAVNQEDLTRGTLGIIRLQRPIVDWATTTPWWRDLVGLLPGRASVVPMAHAVAGVLLVAFVFLMLQTLARSPWGRVLKAIREDDAVASSLGKNVTLYKLQVLMIGAGIAAIAGILYVWNLSNVFPEHFLNIITFFAFIILVMGGIGNHRGVLLGAIILWGIFELANTLTGSLLRAGPAQNIFIGTVLILVMMLRPHGAIGRKEELILGK